MKYIALVAAIGFCACSATAEPEENFDAMDTNSDGYLTQSEYVDGKTAVDDVSDAEALVEFIDIDTDASGAISHLELEIALAETHETESASRQAGG